QTYPTMELHNPQLATGPCISIGQRHGYGFLQGKDIFKVWISPQRIQKPFFNGPWIPEHIMNVICQKLLNNRKAPRFACHGLSSLKGLPLLRVGAWLWSLVSPYQP